MFVCLCVFVCLSLCISVCVCVSHACLFCFVWYIPPDVDHVDVEEYGISTGTVFRNPPVAVLYEQALKNEAGSSITSTGALVVRSGAKTGRSPKDKRIVDEPSTNEDVWWGPVNIKLSEHSFLVYVPTPVPCFLANMKSIDGEREGGFDALLLFLCVMVLFPRTNLLFFPRKRCCEFCAHLYTYM